MRTYEPDYVDVRSCIECKELFCPSDSKQVLCNECRITCKHCYYWKDGNVFGRCTNSYVLEYIEIETAYDFADNYDASFITPHNFNCKYFEEKEEDNE